MLLRTLSLALVLAACEDLPPHVLITVDDPDRIALNADELAIGSFDEQPETRPLEDGLPATFLLTHDRTGVLPVRVDALANGRVLGRATKDVDLEQGPTTLELRIPCDSDADCDDGNFCNGAERCTGDACAVGPPPCVVPSSLAGCIKPNAECDAAATACRFELIDGIDDGDPCTLDLCDGTHVPLDDCSG